MIYLDHNATTPLDPRVLEAMEPYLRAHWGNPSSPYRFGREARLAVERARQQVAECLGCRPDELVFCASGTEADNLAIRGAARALRARGRRLVTSSIEHHAVLNTCLDLESDGHWVTYLPVSSGGEVALQDVEWSFIPDVVLCSVMHANNETGVIQPVEEIARLARERTILFHTDAVQSLGKLRLSLAELGADLVSFSGHKIHGPKGTGLLYVKQGTPLAPLLGGGGQERGLRAGTENVAGIVGLAEAVKLACSAELDGQRLERLRDRLEQGILAAIPRATVNGASARRVPNTSNLSFESVDGESIILGLELSGICVSTGSACSTGAPEPSHVLRAMGLAPRQAQGSIRISLGPETSEQDIDHALRSMVEVVGRLRSISSV